MCGRFAQTRTEKEKLLKRFRLKKIVDDLKPRFNIAPGQSVPVILNEHPDELVRARWGLVPFWAKDEKIGFKMINARAETIGEKPAFRKPIKSQRCLIIADGFYEWQKRDDGKHPHYIHRADGEPFAMAGIWDTWKNEEKELLTCSIITTGPNTVMEGIHHRMPVILSEEAEQQWLSDIPVHEARRLLNPCPPEWLEAYEISTLVNSPANDTPAVIEPVTS
ncbi:MAG: SOS response-associated peptidase [Candidatus Omnitrophica bacterium]|nr:SOS response-associated peptidase [Candidatus Omnitrophota bacterium]MCB9721733.1 SOS response-associated peptidase [Candidatus Omnitrophota bacterium]